MKTSDTKVCINTGRVEVELCEIQYRVKQKLRNRLYLQVGLCDSGTLDLSSLSHLYAEDLVKAACFSHFSCCCITFTLSERVVMPLKNS